MGEDRVKYVALCCDLESPYTEAVKFEQSHGVFSPEMVKVLERHPGVPMTWMVLRDVRAMTAEFYAKEIFPRRSRIDETGMHIHYKYYIGRESGETELYRDRDARRQWTKEAVMQYGRLGLPLPRTFRPGGGDSQENLWYARDFETLYEEAGIRNFLMGTKMMETADLRVKEDLGGGRWRVDGGREVTLISTDVSLEREEGRMYEQLAQRLEGADYALITSHDYNPVVPGNLEKMIEHVGKEYPGAKFVRIGEIGERIRRGELGGGREVRSLPKG